MLRLRLTAKITLLIVVVLIIGFGASTVLTIQRESDLLVVQSKLHARRRVERAGGDARLGQLRPALHAAPATPGPGDVPRQARPREPGAGGCARGDPDGAGLRRVSHAAQAADPVRAPLARGGGGVA